MSLLRCSFSFSFCFLFFSFLFPVTTYFGLFLSSLQQADCRQILFWSSRCVRFLHRCHTPKTPRLCSPPAFCLPPLSPRHCLRTSPLRSCSSNSCPRINQCLWDLPIWLASRNKKSPPSHPPSRLDRVRVRRSAHSTARMSLARRDAVPSPTAGASSRT